MRPVIPLIFLKSPLDRIPLMVYRHHHHKRHASHRCVQAWQCITHSKKMPGESESHEGAALLTNQQVVKKLQLSLSQLARLRAARKISYLRRAGRIFYTAEEVARVWNAFDVPALHPVVALRGSEKE
jgi:hypothetical protein